MQLSLALSAFFSALPAACRLTTTIVVDVLAAPDAAAAATATASAATVAVAVAKAGILAASCDCNFCCTCQLCSRRFCWPQIYVACFHSESVKCALDFPDSSPATASAATVGAQNYLLALR